MMRVYMAFLALAIVLITTSSFSLNSVRPNVIRSRSHIGLQFDGVQSYTAGREMGLFMSQDANAGADEGQVAIWGELKNRIINPEKGTMEEAVDEYLDLCDYGFLNHLSQAAAAAERAGAPEAGALRGALAAINAAMQRRLVAADERLRQILSAGELKTMEAMTRDMVRNNGVDMPFMVILNMNIAQAKQANAEQAEQVLQHLYTTIQEEQDKTLPANVRLLRLLLRTTCDGVREAMLKEQLVIEGFPGVPREERMWGKRDPEVTPSQLARAMEDVLQQTASFDQELDIGVEEKITGLRQEVENVIKKYSTSS
mmetsp:Transcript_19723/g.30943  ORF Transcript_19723/g.30943 Transcript_19723/m.30943 type:complete len:313 (+) Transcript_19723:107-1045(+)